jgi:hypothetical protein
MGTPTSRENSGVPPHRTSSRFADRGRKQVAVRSDSENFPDFLDDLTDPAGFLERARAGCGPRKSDSRDG